MLVSSLKPQYLGKIVARICRVVNTAPQQICGVKIFGNVMNIIWYDVLSGQLGEWRKCNIFEDPRVCGVACYGGFLVFWPKTTVFLAYFFQFSKLWQQISLILAQFIVGEVRNALL